MANEPNAEQRQRGAFQLLRDESRAAHREGDGLRVGHLCEIALQEIERLAKANGLLLSLAELQWVFIFEYYWLLQTHTIRTTAEILGKIPQRTATDAQLAECLACYSFLIEQPLSGHQIAFEKLNALSIEALGNEATPETVELAIHLIELAWFRSASTGEWERLLQRWQQIGPSWMKKLLRDLHARLRVQTRLTCADNSHPPLEVTSAAELRVITPIAELWLLQLCGRWKEVVERIKSLSPRPRPDAYEWRLFADFWHTGLFLSERQTRGEDSQGVWLARRRTMTTDYPLLVFQDQRELWIENKLAELFRVRKEAGGARWEIMTLAMLHELAALRLWDFGMWRQAVVAQSETLLEAAQWPNADVGVTEFGLELAIRASVAKSSRNDFLTRDAVSLLEFATTKVRSDLAYAIFNTYSWQKHAAADLLTDIADLLPENTWLELANWSVGYADDMRERRTAGWRFNPLEFWNELLPNLSNDSEVWRLLSQQILAIARVPHAWYRDDKQLIFGWLIWGPLSAADQIAETIKSISCQTTDAFNRARLLSDAETQRGVSGRWTASLYASVSHPTERLLLARHLGLSNVQQIEQETKVHVERLIRDALIKAAPLRETQKFEFGPQPISIYLIEEWQPSDLGLLRDVVGAIDSPDTMRNWLPFLLNTAQLMVSNGPPEFAQFVRGHARRWIDKPPIGRVSRGETGAFSSIHISDNVTPAILSSLGWLVFQLPRKLGESAHEDLFAWITRIIVLNEISSLPVALHACTVLAARNADVLRNQAISTARSILLTLRVAARDHTNGAYDLAKAINFIGFDLAKQRSELIDWSSSSGQAALTDLLNVITESLPFLCCCSDPLVRSQLAFTLANLIRWHQPDAVLADALQRLTSDSRARVRFAARGGWELAREHDQSQEGAPRK